MRTPKAGPFQNCKSHRKQYNSQESHHLILPNEDVSVTTCAIRLQEVPYSCLTRALFSLQLHQLWLLPPVLHQCLTCPSSDKNGPCQAECRTCFRNVQPEPCPYYRQDSDARSHFWLNRISLEADTLNQMVNALHICFELLMCSNLQLKHLL